MRNKLAITMLMFGLTGAALAQDYSHDAPLTTDNPYTDTKNDRNVVSEKPDCKVVNQSTETRKNADRDRNNTSEDTPDAHSQQDAPQNVIEYGA